MLSARQVPFFNYPDVFLSDEKALLSRIQDVGRRGAYILQRDLEEFEGRIAEYVNARHVIGMANATDALHFAVRAAGIEPGDEVIFCSHTMVATPAAVHFAGATPVPVDCAGDHLIDPDAVEVAITPRTKAILPTQLNGRTANMDRLRAIANRHSLIILEDSAQALGSKFKGQCAGTFGAGGCISFYPAKTLGCLGDGGCLITNDDAVYEQVLLMRDHGRNGEGEVVTWGLNSRLDNMQAAILNHKLKTYERDVHRRREIASLYDQELQAVREVSLPPAPESDTDHYDIYQNYELEVEHRDALQAVLKQQGIGTLIQWGGKAVHQFEKLGFDQSLPHTERMFQRMLMLPMNPSLSDDDVRYVCHCLKQFYSAAAHDRVA